VAVSDADGPLSHADGAQADADVIVIGAGPTGAACAFHLAYRGRRVLLLERQAVGRGKPCGGGMAASVQRWFPFDLRPAVDQVIRRVRFTWCLEDPVTAELPGDAPFWIVRRSVLDAFLASYQTIAALDIGELWAMPLMLRLALIENLRRVAVRIITTDGILYFKADSKYTMVVTADSESLIKKTIKELAEELDPLVFWQVHRSTIVNVDRVRSLRPHLNGECFLKLESGQEVKLSRSFRDKVELLLDRSGSAPATA